MSIATIESTLKSHAGLSALVSNRIYRIRKPQTPTYPLVFFSVEREPVMTLSGESSLKHYMINFQLFGKTYTTLEQIADEVNAAMTTSADFKSILKSVADENFQDELSIYVISVEYSVWF